MDRIEFDLKSGSFSKTICGANLLQVEVGTTGLMGGDSGHGGKTTIKISDEGGTDMKCRWNPNNKSLEIDLGGDSELNTIIEAFEFVAATLRRERDLSRGIQCLRK